MAKNPVIKVKPWCPFCGKDVEQPQAPAQRKMDEFPMGSCQCGALYVSDATGHNLGSALIEALVHACNDNWDLAWELVHEEDYLTGRVENYDEESHQVVETRELDGRTVRGTLYFVRLNEEAAALVGDKYEVIPESDIPPEPVRDPKRKRKRANKTEVKKLVKQGNIDELVALAMDHTQTLRFLQRLLYDFDKDFRYHCAHVTGLVCARLSTRKPGKVSDLLHRMFEACVDSAAAHWGQLEGIGAIIAARPSLFGGFTRHLLMHRNVPSSRIQVLWALGTIAEKRPDIVRETPFYSLFDFLNTDDPDLLGHALRLFGRIRATEVEKRISELTRDSRPLTIYEEGKPVSTTVGELAKTAVQQITPQSTLENKQKIGENT
ncbi:MAG: DVU0298 family protein [Desulfurivibrionaceae bacterium]